MQSGPATNPDPASMTPGMILAGRYRLERSIGAGGFGTVFAAVNANTGERVALKVLSPRILDMAGGAERFRREAELARRLDHPNVVRVLDAGSDPSGALFIAFELLSSSRSSCSRVVACKTRSHSGARSRPGVRWLSVTRCSPRSSTPTTTASSTAT